MGYILPVSQHQYEQYQVRDIKKPVRILQVEKPYRVMFGSAYAHDSNSNYIADMSDTDEAPLNRQNSRSYEHYVSEQRKHLLYTPHQVQPTQQDQTTDNTIKTVNKQVLADITGKGNTFSTQI